VPFIPIAKARSSTALFAKPARLGWFY